MITHLVKKKRKEKEKEKKKEKEMTAILAISGLFSAILWIC
jgi:hypothetical protein